jgi:hypothetical protein
MFVLFIILEVVDEIVQTVVDIHRYVKCSLLNSTKHLKTWLNQLKNIYIHAILKVVCGIIQTATDIHRYVKYTLMNSTKPFEDMVKSVHESLRWLYHEKFHERNEDTKLYNTSSLNPKESLVKYCILYFYYNIFNFLTYCFTVQNLRNLDLRNC